MSNMSYCRFQNTRLDLRECLDVLGEADAIRSREELHAAKRMIEMMAEFLLQNDLIADNPNRGLELDKDRMAEILADCEICGKGYEEA